MSILSVKNLEKKFGDLTVLKDISFNINDGEIISIIGSSGSGKSTLLRCMNQLETITSGTITIDGKTLVETKNGAPVYAGKDILKEILMETGFVFQNFNLLPRQSALENAALPLLYAGVKPKVRRERAREALEKVGLSDRVSFLPTQLSGGQKQRVAIARAMINHPKLLLADEPTGALDTASGEQVMELFHELHKTGVTIVMITHELEIAQHAERILTIRDGRLGEEQVG